MLHPSTKRLLDRLEEMTRQRKIAWTETETGVAYETEGYSVVLTAEPQTLRLLSREGTVLEDVGADAIGATATEEGQSYQQIFAGLAREAARLARGTETAIDEVLAGLGEEAVATGPDMAPAANVQPVDDGQPGSLEDVADETQLAADAQVTEATSEPVEDPDVGQAVANMANEMNAGQQEEPAERSQWSSPLSGMTSAGSFGSFDAVGQPADTQQDNTPPVEPEPVEAEPEPVYQAEAETTEPVPETPAEQTVYAAPASEETGEVTHDWGAPQTTPEEPVAGEPADDETPAAAAWTQPAEQTAEPEPEPEAEPAPAPVWGTASSEESATSAEPAAYTSAPTEEQPAATEPAEPNYTAASEPVASSYTEEPAPAEPAETVQHSWQQPAEEPAEEPTATPAEEETPSDDWPTFGGVAAAASDQVSEVVEAAERVVIDATDEVISRAEDIGEAVDASADELGTAVASGVGAAVAAVSETVEEVASAVEEADEPASDAAVSTNYDPFALRQAETPSAETPPTPDETVAGGVEEEPEEPAPAPRPKPVTRFNPWN